jgi:hypothetical protein
MEQPFPAGARSGVKKGLSRRWPLPPSLLPGGAHLNRGCPPASTTSTVCGTSWLPLAGVRPMRRAA